MSLRTTLIVRPATFSTVSVLMLVLGQFEHLVGRSVDVGRRYTERTLWYFPRLPRLRLGQSRRMLRHDGIYRCAHPLELHCVRPPTILAARPQGRVDGQGQGAILAEV